ncbi:MAG: mannose-1-phosphate guanylyltransferase [Deltaproteobacteria bacterium]|nr:mannose-1-phosphate guanylyltransferase [Deltaproteobacteria bacterium]
MTENAYIVIMAGGKGERFWPLSSPTLPKPFIKLINGKSLIELTYQRAKKILPENRIFFVIGEKHVNPLLQAIPGLREEFIFSEPEGRDTAACIGYAALLLNETNRNSIMVVLPADHYIGKEDLFINAVYRALEVAKKRDCLVTIGIPPTRPETGYGYIKVKAKLSDENPSLFSVDQFIEKPSLDKAKEYVESGDYYWNSGMFVWKTSVILEELEKHLPSLLDGLRKCLSYRKTGDLKAFSSNYKMLIKTSIDYGVMEKSDSVVMIKGEFIWDDVGTWSSLFRLMQKDENSNVCLGNSCLIDVRGSFILSEGVNLGVAGLKNVIVVATKQGVLVCSEEYAQSVREIAKYFFSQ